MFSSYLEVAARLGWRFAWETRYVLFKYIFKLFIMRDVIG
jgi:hypothetical protein